MADNNLMKAEDFAKVSSIDFVNRFSTNIDQLMEILGLTRKIEKLPGTVVKTYKVVGRPESGIVGEGETIPLSKYSTEVAEIFSMDLLKFREATSLESINDKGYEQAVEDTDSALLKDIQKGVRGSFYTFLTSATEATTGDTLQKVLASLWAKNQVLWEDTDASGYLYFVSPEDIADYLGEKDVTVQSAFGFTYLKAFLGLYDVVSYPSIPKGTVITTAKDNVILYYVNPKNGELAKAFDFTVDATGLIGIHRDVNYTNLTTETVMLVGVKFFAENVDGLVKGTIGGATAAAYMADATIPAADPEPPVPEKVTKSSSKADLEAFAAAHGVDLSECSTNEQRYNAIVEHLDTDADSDERLGESSTEGAETNQAD